MEVLSGDGSQPLDRSKATRWLRALLSSEELQTRICVKYFKNFDMDGSGALELPEVEQLVFQLCQHLAVEAPEPGKVQQLFARSDKSRTDSLLPDEFPPFFKTLLKGIDAKLSQTDPERVLEITAIGVSGEPLASAKLPASATVQDLAEELADIVYSRTGTLIALTLLEQNATVLDTTSTLGQLSLAAQASVQAIVSDPSRVRCVTCGEEHQVVLGLPKIAVLAGSCQHCDSPVEGERSRWVDWLQRHRRQLALDQAAALLEQVDTAFDGVVLGRGVTLHESVGLHAFPDADDALLRRLRKNDARQDWRQVRNAAAKQAASGTCPCGCRPGATRFDLTEGTCYPLGSLRDAESVRFHLPAYLTAAIEDAADDNLHRADQLLQFVLLSQGSFARMHLMSGPQCTAVADCIAYFVDMGLRSTTLSPQEVVSVHTLWESGRAA